jgi:RimJ/RimL family protein N-acetyltransferase
VRLEPLGGEHLDAMAEMLADPEVRRLTGTRKVHSAEKLREWVVTRKDHHDRADWAVIVDSLVAGEAVLNDLDAANASVNFRIALHVFGREHDGHPRH